MIRILRLAAAMILFALPLRAEIAIQEVVSPGGIKAWLVEEHRLPFTALEVRFRGGTSLDEPGKRGAVNLMTALIEEGAGEMDSQGFATARDALAASFSFSADEDTIGVSSRFLTENRDAAVDLLRQALIAPRFDPDAVERVRGQVLAGLRSDAKDPGKLASHAFSALAFGTHPYGSSGDGTVDSVTALTRDDIVTAHRNTLARDRIYVAAAGDITPAELGLLLDKLLGDLPATGAPQPGTAKLLLPAGTTVVDFPSPQSVVLFGHQGIRFEDPDFFAASILNEIFGGGRFGARLMTEVREKRGLTYGIGTGLASYDHAELFMGQVATANKTVGEAIQVIRDEWAKMAADGVTQAELDATKTYMTGAYPLRFDGNGQIAKILVGMQMVNLPIDYPATRNARIEAVTLADVNRVAKRMFQPDALQFVIAGQPEGIATSN